MEKDTFVKIEDIRNELEIKISLMKKSIEYTIEVLERDFQRISQLLIEEAEEKIKNLNKEAGS